MMTQQEGKQLLFIDLCARLPYKVKIRTYSCINNWINDCGEVIDEELTLDILKNAPFISKPYLRSMLDMTDEELEELLNSQDVDYDGGRELVRRSMAAYSENKPLESNALFSIQYAKVIDWLNIHHFDYRGLIEKGLAIKVTKENNPYESKS